ncbi:MAG: efflux RND transporter permease subunit [Hyphomonadaceae bacterium]|jgi:multidrug efflux pump subunit AcrB|nr:efflux RND transporter permease subunit [Hyphomonadaceae bacterium]
MRNISSWAIKNPIPPIVLFLILTIMGIGSFLRLPINSNPDISFPAFTVSVGLSGAAPAELENQVATIIEGALVSIDGVKDMRTTLTTGGSTTFVELEIGADISKAVDDARAAVGSVRASLPADVYEPQVQRIDFNDQEPLAIYSVDMPSVPTEQLTWLVDREFSRQLLSVEGVGRVERWNGESREIVVELDPARMTSLGATAADVSRALRSENLDLPGGVAETGDGRQTIRTLGAVRTVEDLGAMTVPVSGGRVIRLSDIADVRDGASEIRGVGRFNDRPVIMFQVQRAKESSALDAARLVDAKIQQLREQYPAANIQPVFTPTDYVQESYDLSMVTLFEGALLATLVVAVFLGGWRPVFAAAAIIAAVVFGGAWLLEKFAGVHIDKVVLFAVGTLLLAIVTLIIKPGRATFLAAIAIPLSIIPTFAFMEWMGFTLNEVTLLALALVAGILVDDAIVEIENIVRHIHMGKSPFQAALEAADEIGLAVVATSATIVAVFVPVSFMTGIVGQFFISFGLTVAMATIFSLLVARLITPLMAAYLLPRQADHEEADNFSLFYLGFLEKMLLARFKFRALGRERSFYWGRWATVFGGLFMGALSVVAIMNAPQTFTPTVDQGFVQSRIDLPPGLSSREADERARQVARILMETEGAKDVVQVVNGDLTGAQYFVTMVPREERSVSQQEYEQLVRGKLAELPGLRAQFGGGWGSNNLSINLVSDDAAALSAAARSVTEKLRAYPWAVDIKNSADLTRPELHVIPRREEAARLGVSVLSIAQAARIATDGDIDTNLPKFNAGERQIPIAVRLSREARADVETIKALRVPTQFGTTVPLDAVAEVRFGGGETRIERRDRQRVVTVSASLQGIELGPALAELSKQDWYKTPGPGVTIKPDGDAEELGDMFSQFLNAILLGVLMIYCVLVLLFKDFLHPITFISVILLAPAGAFFALFLVQEPFSLPVLIGLLMLIGIVTKNSILLVDFAVESERLHGLPRHEALMDAARKRSRPIIMTTIAMIAGMVPAAMTTAGAGAFRHGMAIAVIGGLTLSTVLSLVFVPAVYTLVDDLSKWLRGLFKGVSTVTQEEKAAAIHEEIVRRASGAPAE